MLGKLYNKKLNLQILITGSIMVMIKNEENPKMKKGFTLAEVLITLGIIGVVAALTIPVLVGKYQERATVTAVKKAYNIFTTATMRAVEENGTPDTWDLGTAQGNAQGAKNVLDILLPYLKTAKVCYGEPGCFASGKYKAGAGVMFSDYDGNAGNAKAVLADGSSIFINILGPACNFTNHWNRPENTPGKQIDTEILNQCVWIGVDINGPRKPNEEGRDVFHFLITKGGKLIPDGAPGDEEIRNCAHMSPNSNYGANKGVGQGCTGWVVFNGNMDYLRKNISW